MKKKRAVHILILRPKAEDVSVYSVLTICSANLITSALRCRGSFLRFNDEIKLKWLGGGGKKSIQVAVKYFLLKEKKEEGFCSISKNLWLRYFIISQTENRSQYHRNSFIKYSVCILI